MLAECSVAEWPHPPRGRLADKETRPPLLGEALSIQLRFAELSGEFLRLAQAGVGLLGLLEADVAVAVLVEQLELLGSAEELARRDVAVAVAVHLAEPHRAGVGYPHRRCLAGDRPHIRIR